MPTGPRGNFLHWIAKTRNHRPVLHLNGENVDRVGSMYRDGRGVESVTGPTCGAPGAENANGDFITCIWRHYQ